MSTIAAISTGRAPGGIGVVRISGEDAINIGDKIFSSFGGKKLCDIDGYSALYGKAHDKDGDIDKDDAEITPAMSKMSRYMQ